MTFLRSIWHGITSTFGFLWQIVLWMWVGLHAFGEWCQQVLPGLCTKTSFPEKLVLFVGWFLFAPFPWWTGFVFFLIPVIVAIPALVFFFVFYFVFSLAQSVVFI